MNGTIYLITNLINGKQYVGQTIRDVNIRYKEHLEEALYTNRNLHLYNSIRKYGISNFKLDIIETNIFDEKTLNEKEIYYIQLYNTYENGYNNTKGGGGVKGYHHNNETKNKISKAVKENMYKINTPERTAKIIKAQKGRKFTDLHKKHISESCKGKRFGVNNSFYGKTHSNESKLKMSQSSTKYLVEQLDMNNNLLNTFNSVLEAANYISNNKITNAKISSIQYRIYITCIGKQSNAYNYKWKYKEKCIDYSERK